MITIEVDCNNDKLSIKDSTGHLDKELSVKLPTELCKLLSILLDEISGKVDVVLGVELIKIDEDTRTTIGEW